MPTPDNAEQPAGPPPNIVLMQMMLGYYLSRSLHVAATLGIADLVAAGTRGAGELAAATGTHAPSLRRLMRWLASNGLFVEEDDGAFTLTPIGECLRSGVPGSMRAGVLLFTGMTQDAWRDLLYSVQTGEPAFPRVFGTDSFSYMAQHPDDAANFDAAMADFTAFVAAAVSAAYDFSGLGTLVDVGGGNGMLLAGILRANPSLRGILFDLPHVAERARARLADDGLADRCTAIGGDFFTDVPPGGDAYVLKHVIHDWDDARALAILRSCRRAMRAHAKLLIVEGIYPARVEASLASRAAASNDMNMLVCTGGRQRSEAEFRTLYAQAGFALTRIVPTMANSCVIEGVPAAAERAA
jgi:O-methyltransferase domain